MPKVSIVTPHFERPALLRDTVESVQRSSFADWEMVIVDDGSSMDAWNSVQPLADGHQVRILRRQGQKKGPSACRNEGLAQTKAEYVLFLDSDDLLAPWCLEQRWAAAVGNPAVDLLVFPAILFSDRPGDADLLWNSFSKEDDDLNRFLRSDGPWCVSSPLWRRIALESLHGFNEQVFYGDDADLHIRALLSGRSVKCFPDVLPDVFIRRSDSPRITRGANPSLVESRRVRLREGARCLRAAANAAGLKLWEGQYFMEAEFLLFNLETPRLPLQQVLLDWEQEFQPCWWFRKAVRTYFAFAIVCRHRAYLLLRVARRMAMKMLPAEFFSQGGGFQSFRATPEVMQAVRRELDLLSPRETEP